MLPKEDLVKIPDFDTDDSMIGVHWDDINSDAEMPSIESDKEENKWSVAVKGMQKNRK